MVKYRGIDVSVVSQFDIRRLPEFERPLDDNNNTASSDENAVNRYIPIYPGSQIWFEYSIEPPHPPGSMYFFKLVINGQTVTSWDCTEEHGYHGKAIYALGSTSRPNETYLHSGIDRKGFQFSNNNNSDDDNDHDDDQVEHDPDDQSDCIETRVHRVERRQRERGFFLPTATTMTDKVEDLQLSKNGRLRLINGGRLELGRPCRRYKYQLLDPVDDPYAIFRFFYRTSEFLMRNGIIVANHSSTLTPTLTPSAFSSSTIISTSTQSIQSSPIIINHQSPRRERERGTPTKRLRSAVIESPSSSPSRMKPTSLPTERGSSVVNSKFNTLSPPIKKSNKSNNDDGGGGEDGDSLLRTKDSIEELSSTVPRSPQSPRSKSNSKSKNGGRLQRMTVVESPTRASKSSARKKNRNELTLDIHGDGDGGVMVKSGERKRPLSPFTNGGVLRRIMSIEKRQSDEEEQAVRTRSEEVELLDEDDEDQVGRTSVLDRGERRTTRRRPFMRFLSRRVTLT